MKENCYAIHRLACVWTTLLPLCLAAGQTTQETALLQVNQATSPNVNNLILPIMGTNSVYCNVAVAAINELL